MTATAKAAKSLSEIESLFGKRSLYDLPALEPVIVRPAPVQGPSQCGERFEVCTSCGDTFIWTLVDSGACVACHAKGGR